MFKKSLLGFCLTMSALTTVEVIAQDQSGAIRYRQNYMSAVAGHFGAIRRLVKGDVQHEGDLLMHTEALAALSRDLTKLFPEGSGEGKTEAKAEIWSDWAGFSEVATGTEEKAQALLAAVQSEDAEKIDQTLSEFGKTCRGCHNTYRE